MRNILTKIKDWFIYLFSSKEERLIIRLRKNRVRIVDLMDIKLNGQKGLNDETVRKLNDVFRNYAPTISDRPIGVDRIAEIMYYDKQNQIRLTDTAIEGLNSIFDNSVKDNSVEEDRKAFFDFLTKKGIRYV